MKKNFMTLAFMLVFASTTVFAEGELNHGTRTAEPPPATETSSQTDSTTLLNQVLNAIYAIIA